MKPFVKWAGGKTLVYKNTSEFFPKTFGTYYEPFLGGGSVFFNLAPKSAVIADVNVSLINCYEQIRDNPSSVINILNGFKANISKDFYLKIRKDFNKNPIEKTARKAAEFVFLNKMCFNGLFRVNKKGEFNVPFGNGASRRCIFEKDNLFEISKHLNINNINISTLDFRKTIAKAKYGDFIYADPPYLVKDGSFTSYNADGFGKKDYTDLIECLIVASKRGVKIVVSNSIDDDNLFSGFTKNTIERRTSVSGHVRVRIKTPEYVYTMGAF